MLQCDSAHTILFLTRLIEEILLYELCKIEYPVKLYEDNSAAIQNSVGTFHKSKLKFVELRYLKMKEYFESNILKAIKIETDNQLADILTKPLLEVKFKKLRDLFMTEIQ